MQDNTVHSDPSFYKITVVTDETNVNVTQGITKVIEVVTPGPQGPKGADGTGGGGSSDLTALNSFSASMLTFTGSIQTQVNNLTAATSSYVRTSTTQSMLQPYVLTSTTSSMIVSGAFTASYYRETDPIFVAARASLATTGSNYFSSSQTIQGDLIPAGPYVNNTSSYSLGSPTAAWKDLYVSNGSVTFINGATSASIKFDNGNVIFTGASVTLPTSSTVTTAQTASHLNTLNQNLTISGSLTLLNNLTVFGTQSVLYITSSQLDISTNLITVNTSTPAIRFGGIAVKDSGSLATGLTGSLLWDSQNDVWIYSNPSGAAYDGGLVIMGPRNSSGLGNEVGISSNALAKGNGSHHVTSSQITDDGTTVTIPGDLTVNGTLQVPSSIDSTVRVLYDRNEASILDWYDLSTATFNGTASYATTASYANTANLAVSSSVTTVKRGSTWPSYITFVNEYYPSPTHQQLYAFDAAIFLSQSNGVIRLHTPSVVSPSGFTGSLEGTASLAATASYVDNLNQDVVINGTLSVSGEIYGLQGQVTALASRNYLFSGF